MRLDRFLSARTMYSRSELRKILQKGNVRVDGAVVKQADSKVTEANQITLFEQEIPNVPYLYILLHKPKGYVSSADEPGQHSVLELIPPHLQRKNLRPAGRLDKDTTGMLLLTDDGQFAHQVTAPHRRAAKYYIAQLARPWEDGYAERLADGILLADGTHCLAAQAAVISHRTNKILICLHEGKYHQVRRMMAALGNHVEELERIAIGGLALPSSLACGDCLVLHDEDIQKILHSECNFASMLQNSQKNSS